MTSVLAVIDSVASASPSAWALSASVAAGAVVGLWLGLTGGGGAIFAVPLLVYAIGVEPRAAVGVSLVAFATMDVPRAVGTSLFVMTLVGGAAVVTQVAAGRSIPADVAGGFVAGSVPALLLGSWIGRRLGGPRRARTFALAIVIVAVFVTGRALTGG